jgi:hypothetical protein
VKAAAAMIRTPTDTPSKRFVTATSSSGVDRYQTR